MELRGKITATNVTRRAATLALQMEAKAADVCLPTGTEKLRGAQGISPMLSVLRKHYAPDVAQFIYLQAIEQATDAHLVEFDLLRRKTEGRMQHRRIFPGTIESLLCEQKTN